MQKLSALDYLAGVESTEKTQASAPTNLHVISGEVSSKSEDGIAKVSFDGLVYSEDETQEIEIEALGGLEEGDTVTILLSGEQGHGMTPLALGSVGSIDRIVTNVSEIQADYVKATELEADVAELGYAHITDGVIDNATIDVADINELSATVAEIADAQIANATIEQAQVRNLSVDYASASNLEAAEARIGTLESTALTADSATIQNLEADTAKIHNLTANQISAATGYVAALTAGNVTAQNIISDHGDFSTVKADSAKIHNLTAQELSAATGYVGALTAGNVTAQNIISDHGDFSTVKADSAKIHNLTANQISAATGYVGALTAGNVTAQNIIADHGDFSTVKANAAKVANLTAQELEADHATIGSLDANYAQIDMANVNNGWITNGTIKNAAIKSQMVESISASQLTAGTIDADEITVRNLQASSLKIQTADGYIYVGEKRIPTKEFLDSLKDELQAEIDGAIETFTVSAIPTLNNTPANDWVVSGDAEATRKLRAKHVGDIVYVINEGSSANGHCYRFAYDNTTQTFGWVLIQDSDVTSALSRISDLETFESNTTSWIEETDEGLTTIRQNHTTLSGKVDKTVVETKQLWYTKSNTTAPGKPTAEVTSTSTAGNAWRVVVPAYSASYPNYYYCLQYKLADGTFAWSDVVRDIAMGESQQQGRKGVSDAATAQTTANNAATAASTADGKAVAAQTTANSNIKSSVQLWFTKSNTTAPSKPTTQVTTNSASTVNAWNLAIPTYNSSYPNYFSCYQQQKGDGTWQWTDVVFDRSITEAQAKAQAALPSSEFTTFQSTTFKNLVDEVDEQSSTITNLTTTVSNKADSSTVTTLSNTVNSVSQTTNSNSQYITNLTTTLGTNADGTSKSEDIVHKYNQLDQTLDGTISRVGTTEASLTTISNRNLSPFYSHPLDDVNNTTSNPDGYWGSNQTGMGCTSLVDGWTHYEKTNTASSTIWLQVYESATWRNAHGGLKGDTKYTVLLEFRNVTKSGNVLATGITMHATSNPSMFVDNTTSKPVVDGEQYHVGMTVADTTASGIKVSTRTLITVPAGASISCDFRVSLYEGEYDGPYKPYVDQSLATRMSSAETSIAQTATDINLRVQKNDVINQINLSTEGATINANRVNIEGAAIFTGTGRLSSTSLNNAYDSKGSASAVQQNLDNLEVGGRNLLRGMPVSYSKNAYLVYVINTTIALNELDVGDTITVQLWGVDVDTNSSSVGVYWGGDRINLSPNTTPDTNGYWKATYTLTSGHKSEANASNKFVHIYNLVNGHSGASLSIERWKIERGNKSTDWSPAPEDVDDSINAIQVGGRNLLKCSKVSSENLAKVLSSGAAYTSFVIEDGYACYKVTGASTNGLLYGTNKSSTDVAVRLEADTTYIYSAWIKVTTTVSGVTSLNHSFTSLGHHQVYNAASTKSDKAHEEVVEKRVYLPKTVNVGEWTHITEQFTTNSLAGSYFGKYPKYNLGDEYTVYVRDMKLEKGTRATDWTPAPEDVDASISTAQSTANANVHRTQRIYYRKATSGAPSVPSAWVEQSGDVRNSWTAKAPRLTENADGSGTKYPALYTCEQYQMGDGRIGCTPVLLDDSQTVIDGGNIITGSVTANEIDSTNLHVSAANIDGYIGFGQLTDVPEYALSNDIPTKVSDLTNDSGFQTSAQVESAITGKGYALDSNLTTEINQRKAQYGTSSTAVGTTPKVVSCTNFELVAGNEITVKFTTANTSAAKVQLNVNSKGAKDIWVGNAVTSATNQLLWGAGAYITFRYDGAQFQVIGEPRTWYGASTTAEGTAAKSDTTAVTGCVICKGSKVELAMSNANTAASPTLNIQSTGAKAIYFGNGTTRPTKVGGTSWLATNTCTFTFDGAAWRTQGKTYIDANSIVTGYLSADRLEAGSIAAGKLDADSIKTDIVQTTELDAAKITSGDITAARIKANVISAINSLTAGKIDADRINVGEINIGSLSGSIGGRNLLRGTSTMTAGNGRWDTTQTFRASGGTLSNVTTSELPIPSVSGALRITNTGSSAAQIGFAQDHVKGIIAGETYTQGAWVRASTTMNVFHQPIYKTGTQFIKGDPVSIGTDWTYITYTGVLSGAQATDYYNAGYMYAQNVPANGWFEVCGLKLEKGNKATDWTPSSEDVDEYAKTATNYISANSSGIKIANETPSTATTYQLQTATGTDFVVAGAVRNQINGDGMTLYDGSGTANANIVAKFSRNLVELGQNAASAIIKLCGGIGSISVVDGYMRITSDLLGLFTTHNKAHVAVVETSSESDGVTTYSGGVAIRAIDEDDVVTASIEVDANVANDWGNCPQVVIKADKVVADGDFIASGVTTLTPTVLYTGTAKGDFTLSTTAVNFTRLRVYFTANNGGKGVTDVYSPNSSKFTCSTTHFANNTTMQHEFAQWSISGTSVTWQNAGYLNLATGSSVTGSVTKLTSTTNQITINRVEGWKW